MINRILQLLLPVLLVGCVNKPAPLSGPRLAVLAMTELPPPSPDFAERGFALGPLDVVDVDVFGVEDLSREEIQIGANGTFSFPLAGSIKATNKTADMVAREIEDRLRAQYVRDPHVTVNLRRSLSQQITVDGQVTEPGGYPATEDMTLMRAIASAKGVSEFARLTEVVVFRKVQGQDMAALYDVAAIRRGQYSDPPVYPGDVIVVGDSPGRRLFRDIIQSSTLIASPIVALLQR